MRDLIQELIKKDSVNKIWYKNKWYFDINSVAEYINEDLSNIETIEVVFDNTKLKFTTIEKIEDYNNLSDFNKALLKTRNFKK